MSAQLIVHLPLHMRQLPSVRRLALAHPELAPAVGWVVLLWLEFAQSGEERRALTSPEDWSQEPLVALIEEGCEWTGLRGHLFQAFLEAGVLAVSGESLVAPDWVKFNEHFRAGFQTPGAKSGASRLLRGAERQAQRMAQQLLQPVTELELNREETARAFQFLVKLDRACGHVASGEYTTLETREIVVFLADKQEDEVEAFLRWIIKSRKDPNVPTMPSAIRARPDSYWGRFKAAELAAA